MDFNLKNISHIFAGLMVFISFIVFIGFPLLSLFFPIMEINTTNQIENIQDGFGLIFEIILFVIQILIVILLFVLVPFLWYRLVNNYSLKQILKNIQLKKENLDMAFLWGVITAIIAIGMVLILSAVISVLGIADENISNIQDIEQFFSLPIILILITFQPISEEIFFRGFLLDKLNNRFGKNQAIIVTSILFGIAHVSMGNVIPAIIISIVALIFGYMVMKTRNLMTSIIGHILFNIINFLFYLIGQQILSEGLIF
jgi:membrane protease YdiL (CAAX protease family)